jgi:hypothetical protein
MENCAVTNPPELIVKFWPPSVTAKGVPAINAIRRPLAFAVYSRPVVSIILGLALVWGGHENVGSAFRFIKAFF